MCIHGANFQLDESEFLSLREEEREIRSVTAHNTTEYNEIFGKHQPGGTVIVCRHKVCSVRKETVCRPKRFRTMVLVAFLVQTYPCYQDSSRLQAMA